jgi:hypothetical protein
LVIRLDQLGPAAFERRTFALMDGRVAVQPRTGIVSVRRPELRGVLVGGCRRLMPSRGVAVALRRRGHRPSMPRNQPSHDSERHARDHLIDETEAGLRVVLRGHLARTSAIETRTFGSRVIFERYRRAHAELD